MKILETLGRNSDFGTVLFQLYFNKSENGDRGREGREKRWEERKTDRQLKKEKWGTENDRVRESEVE